MSEAKLDCPFPKLFPSQLLRDDVFYMSLAYNQAVDAWREDEVPVGAIIELGGEVIAAAHNQVDGTRIRRRMPKCWPFRRPLRPSARPA